MDDGSVPVAVGTSSSVEDPAPGAERWVASKTEDVAHLLPFEPEKLMAT